MAGFGLLLMSFAVFVLYRKHGAGTIQLAGAVILLTYLAGVGVAVTLGAETG